MLKVGHYVERPGRRLQDPPVSIPVAEELETVPGAPIHQEDVEFNIPWRPSRSASARPKAGLI